MRSPDTSPDAHAAVIPARRAMAPGELIVEAIRLSDEAVAVAEAGIRARHPDYGDEQVTWALRRLRLGDDLLRQAWPDAPLVAT
jgi:hypothetical protein